MVAKKKGGSKKKTTSKRSTKKPTKKRVSKKKTSVDRVATKIKNFDSLIEGGFEKNSTNLVIGSSGSGKSIFAMQFLIGGMEKGEKCLFVTFEEKKKQFYENMATIGVDLEAYEKKGLFTFLEYTPIKVKTMLEEGGGAIENLILSKKVTRIVIDSITSFLLLFDKEIDKREAGMSLFSMIGDWNCTSVLTFEGQSGSTKATQGSIEFEADSIIIMYYERDKAERERYLEILKMRGTDHSKKLYKFDIKKKGIEVSKKTVRRSKR